MRNVLRLALVFLAIGLLRYFIATVMGLVRKHSARQPGEPKPQPGDPVASAGRLRRDPVCGTYVSEASAITATIAGSTVHYCSAACRDKHLDQRRA